MTSTHNSGGNLFQITRHNAHTCTHTRGKRIRVFLSGDYEFLTRMYGLSGASGRSFLDIQINVQHIPKQDVTSACGV